MAYFRVGATAALAAAVVLSACSSNEREPKLLHFSRAGSPDEFGITPAKAIEYPDSIAELPTPGGANRADLTPKRDAIVALGGSLRRGEDGVLPSANANLLAHTGRFGLDPDIRQRLAREDLEFRRENDGLLMERWFRVNVYAREYQPFALDSRAEADRLRSLGYRTPSAPPKPVE